MRRLAPVIDDVEVTAAPNVVKTKVWYTWTGGPVTSAPSFPNAGWHPTNGDPQSKLHKAENHTDGLPYYVANNGNNGRRRLGPLARDHRLIHRTSQQQPVPRRRGGLYNSTATPCHEIGRPDVSDPLLAFPPELFDRSTDEMNYLEILRVKSRRTVLSSAEARALIALEDLLAADEDRPCVDVPQPDSGRGRGRAARLR